MKTKRITAILLILAMLLTMGTGVSFAETTKTTAGFTDINGHWAESIIKEAASLKIVGGYPDGTFAPDNLINRQEFYKLLTNILTVTPDTANTKITFTDVVSYEWYVPTIKIAVAAGITSGYADGTFGINMMISRQEAAKVAGSVISNNAGADSKGAEIALDKASIADWAYKYVDLMFKKGYMKGDNEGNFRPTVALTRAEAAAILLNVKKNETVIAGNPSTQPAVLGGCTDIHGTGADAFTKGEGTQAEPYEISTAAQLNHLRKHTSEGAFYILTKNIAITEDYATVVPAAALDEDNWSGGNFQPIGTRLIPFAGHIDGKGYKISGLNISGISGESKASKEDQFGASYTGLFGCLGKNSSVEDLIVDASTITGELYTGAIAGYSEGTIKDCQLGTKSIVNGVKYTGGIVGYSTNAISSLKNLGTVNGKWENTGGIAGAVNVAGKAISYCQNDGTVSGSDKTGGIVGEFEPSVAASQIQECDNNGTVEAGSYNAGGIAGLASGKEYAATIEDCENKGSVKGSGLNGGIAGYVETSNANITDCKNTGTVSGGGAGGIAGNNEGTISYSYNSGKVTANTYAGGIAAYQKESKGTVTKCYNEGTVFAKSYAGGIVGENTAKVDNCYNTGKVDGTNYVGGIAGRNAKNITNVYNIAEITGFDSVGSLVGRNAGVLSYSYWLEGTNSMVIGLSDTAGAQQYVTKVTKEELSGQTKIKTSSGYELIVDIMNSNNATKEDIANKSQPEAVWKFVYSTVQSTSNEESAGNAISPDDLNNKYLYPSIID